MTSPSPAALEAARLAVCALWLLALPLLTRGLIARLRAFTSRAIRIRVWRRDMAISWAAALACLACAGGLDVFAPGYADWRGPAVGALSWPALRAGLLAVLLALFAWQTFGAARCGLDAARRARLAPALRPLRWMLPASAVERRWWIAVSLTAGITEEIVVRGCLLPDLQGAGVASPLVHLPLWAAWAGSSLAFGFGHLYQGVQGVVRTALAGLFMGALAILSGGLAVPIVVHVLADAQMLCLYRPDRDDPAQAARLVEGCAGAA
jgi:membrane protease YdiL (CAAX protease family)